MMDYCCIFLLSLSLSFSLSLSCLKLKIEEPSGNGEAKVRDEKHGALEPIAGAVDDDGIDDKHDD